MKKFKVSWVDKVKKNVSIEANTAQEAREIGYKAIMILQK